VKGAKAGDEIAEGAKHQPQFLAAGVRPFEEDAIHGPGGLRGEHRRGSRIELQRHTHEPCKSGAPAIAAPVSGGRISQQGAKSFTWSSGSGEDGRRDNAFPSAREQAWLSLRRWRIECISART
jgi:hypothetical protein